MAGLPDARAAARRWDGPDVDRERPRRPIGAASTSSTRTRARVSQFDIGVDGNAHAQDTGFRRHGSVAGRHRRRSGRPPRLRRQPGRQPRQHLRRRRRGGADLRLRASPPAHEPGADRAQPRRGQRLRHQLHRRLGLAVRRHRCGRARAEAARRRRGRRDRRRASPSAPMAPASTSPTRRPAAPSRSSRSTRPSGDLTPKAQPVDAGGRAARHRRGRRPRLRGQRGWQHGLAVRGRRPVAP